MRTNIDIDDKLLAEAMRLSGAPTKKSAVEAGLVELVRRNRVRRVNKLRGTVEWVGDLDEMRAGWQETA